MKKIKNLICLMLVFIVALVLTACSIVGGNADVSNADELHEATKGGSVQKTSGPGGTTYDYKGDETDINITSDFTIMADHDFFTYNLYDTWDKGRIMANMTLEGNGHTITIKGEVNGKLGRYNTGLFARMDYCTVRNLNIVYDIDLNIDGSDGSYFGGLTADACGTIIDNVTVTYNRKTKISFMTDGYGYHDSKFGGLVGVSGQATITNCKVKGNINGTAGFLGGILGYQYRDTSIKNCVFDGSLTTFKMEECFVGGLVGYGAGEICSSAVYTDKLHFVGQPQSWRTETSSVGGLVGKLAGNLHDCYLEFKENGYFIAESINSGAFITYINSGVLVGEAAQGSKVKNIYADASADIDSNFKKSDNSLTVNLGIGKNKSTEVSNVFFIDDAFGYKYSETFTANNEPYETGVRFNGTIHELDACVDVCLEYDEEDQSYDIDKIILTIGENIYDLTTWNFIEGNPQYWDRYGDHQYIITLIKVNENTYDIKFEKNIYGINLDEGVFVSEYSDIQFGDNSNVIGGEESYWEYDSVTNKPTLKNLQ